MNYAVGTMEEDKGETYYGTFNSIKEATDWANNNIEQWWWVIRINEIEFYDHVS